MKVCKNNNKIQMTIKKTKKMYKIDIINPVKMVILTEYPGGGTIYLQFLLQRPMSNMLHKIALEIETILGMKFSKAILMTIKTSRKRNE